MSHEKNIFKELDEQIKLDIDKDALKESSKLMDEVFTLNTTTEQIMFLKDAYYRLYKSTEADRWFKNKSHLEDLDRIQESYDKEIGELNEVIQRNAKK